MEANSIDIANINIGSLIERELKGSGMTQAEFARRLNIPPSNVTRLFKKETIETSKLMELCDILDYNFFSEYCSDLDNARNGYSLNREVQIGIKIESRLRDIKMTQVEFAGFLGVKQPVISRILKKDSIDTGRLSEISKILEYNFFADFYTKAISNENQENASPQNATIPSAESLKPWEKILKQDGGLVSERQWREVLKRNENLASENARLKEQLRFFRLVYSQLQKFKQDNNISDNWDELPMREGVDNKGATYLYYIDTITKGILDEFGQSNASDEPEQEGF